jgi:hypothetical protein
MRKVLLPILRKIETVRTGVEVPMWEGYVLLDHVVSLPITVLTYLFMFKICICF